MKKTLLLSLAAVAGFSAMAAEPEILANAYAAGISPNGKYGVSLIYGNIKVVDLTTGQVVFEFFDDMSEPSIGNGNRVANDGTVVGSFGDKAAWSKNGQFELLNDEIETLGMSFAEGITPDGKRIVGMFSNPDNPVMDMDRTMDIPCYWDVNADGTVGEVQTLPYPELDFSGRAPQYVFANNVSDDGEVIAGMVTDFSGMLEYPIVYTRNEAGEWEYTLPAESLINPNHLEFPVVPPSPEDLYPDVYSFMTPAEKAAYEAALMEYWQTWDPELEPNLEDYMAPAAYAAYMAAMQAWEKANDEYYEAFMAFNEVLEQVIEESQVFVRGNHSLSPDGTLLAVGAKKGGRTFWEPSTFYTTYFNLVTGEFKTLGEEAGAMPNGINDKGFIYASTPLAVMGGNPVQSFVKTPGNEDMIPVEEYLAIDNAEVANWMNDNLKHEVMGFDDEWNEVVVEENYMYSGIAFFSQDCSVIFSGVMPAWPDYEADFPEYFCYYTGGLKSGVKTVGLDVKESVKVAAERGGVLHITGAADAVVVYDLAGREVFSGKAAATVSTGLPSGLYLVKTEGAAGVKTTKVTF